MALPVLPPDMVAAGITPAPSQPITPTQSTLPAPAVQQMQQADNGLGLMNMLRAPAQLPNPGLAVGAGMLDSLAGARGGNTYLAQHQQQVDRQQAQQMQQVGLLDRMQERRRQQLEKQDAVMMEFLNGLKDSDDPRAQEVYGMEMSRRAKGMGLDIKPESFAQTAKIGKEELDLINGDIVAGLPPAQIIARHPKLQRMPPSWLADQTKILQNPTMRNKLGYKTDDELKVDRVERDRKIAEGELATWRAQHRDVDDKTLPYLAQYIQSQAGIPLIGLDPSNPVHQKLKGEGLAWARAQVQANDTAWQTLQESKRAHRVGESQKERELRLKELESGGGFGKPLSAEATQKITGVVRLSDAVSKIDGIVNDPKAWATVESYIGPYASRVATAQRWAPGGLLGQTPEEVVNLRQNLATLKNYVINLITGAAMGEKEAERIMQEIPDISLPPDQFKIYYANTKANVARMRQIVDAALIRGDRRALAVMQEIEGTPPRPAPGPLNPAPTPTAGWGRAERVR